MVTAPLADGFSTDDGVPPPVAAEPQTKLGRYFSRIAIVFPNFPHVLAILISCLGLFALAAYMAERRTKEIGIRKVLGADTFNIALLLAKNFMLLIILAYLAFVAAVLITS